MPEDIPTNTLSAQLNHQGGQLLLRPFQPSDLACVTQAIDTSAEQLQQFSPWALALSGEDSVHTLLNGWIADLTTGSNYELGLFDAQQRLMASVALSRLTPNPKCLDLSVWTPTPYVRRGNATQALRSAVAMAFERLGVVRLQMSHDINNRRSRGLAQRCGFRPEGICRGLTKLGFSSEVYLGCGDAALYGLVPEDLPNLEWYPLVAHSLRA